MDSELWLQLSIWVLILSEYDIHVKDAVFHVLSPPVLHFAIKSIFVVLLRKISNFWHYFTATQRILIRSQSGGLDVEEHAKLHVLRIYHIVIQSELKYWIGAKVLSWRNCETGQKTAGSVLFGLLIGLNPLHWCPFGSNPDLEPNCRFGTVANSNYNKVEVIRWYGCMFDTLQRMAWVRSIML